MTSRCRAIALVCASLMLAVAIAGTARAAPPVTVIGSGLTGKPYVLRDDIVLETTGLVEAIRDFADWQAPAWVGWNDHGFTFDWSGVVAEGGLVVAFNADPRRFPLGFSVNDLRDPAAPAELCVAAGLPVASAWLRDGVLLVGLEDAVIAYDLADPAAPAFSGLVPVGRHVGRRWFSAVGDTLYLVDQGAAVRRLDVTDPRHPVDRGVTRLTGDRIDALAGGDGVLYALVAGAGGAGGSAVDLVSWDAATAGAPLVTDRRPLCAGAGAAGRTLVRAGDLLLAATSDGRLRAFGLAAPARPAPGWTLDHDTDHVVVSRSAMFVSAADGLYVYGRVGHDRDPAQPIRRTPLPRLAAVAGRGPVQVAQFDDDRSLLVPVDVSQPAQPRLGKPIATGFGGTLQVVDGVGLMRDGAAGVRLLDLSDPYRPLPRARVALPRPESTGFLATGELLVVDRKAPVQPVFDLYDVRAADAPQLVATILDRNPLGTGGDWLVCGGGGADHRDDPRVYKLDGRSAPSRLGELRTTLATVRLARAVDDCLYLFGQDPAGDWALEVHRVRNQPVPRFVRAMPLGMAPAQVDRDAGRLFVQGDRECRVYDVAEPSSPVLAASFPALREAGTGFALNGDVATVSGRLVTVRSAAGAAAAAPALPLPAGVRLEPARPNPFNPGTTVTFVVDRERDLTLTAYDARGRLVGELTRGRFAAGAHAVAWDGSARGAPVASGVYFLRLHGPGVEAVQAVTLLK